MYYFIVNPNASRGRGGRIWRKMERRLWRSGLEYELFMTEKPGDAGRFSARLTEPGSDGLVLVVVGGDGTLNEVVNGISFRGQVTLGYIPAGTGNDLARSLKLPRSPQRCLKKVLNQKTVKLLDYGVLSYECGEPVCRRFLISSGIGLDAQVCRKIMEARLQSGGRMRVPARLEYIVYGLCQLVTARPVNGYLILDGTRRIEFNHIYFISTHIQPFEGGGFRFAPKADGSDGLLDVCVMQPSAKRKLIPIMADALFGKVKCRHGVRSYTCREVRIHVDSPLSVHADGENCFSQTDIHLRCIGRKVRMLV